MAVVSVGACFVDILNKATRGTEITNILILKGCVAVFMRSLRVRWGIAGPGVFVIGPASFLPPYDVLSFSNVDL